MSSLRNATVVAALCLWGCGNSATPPSIEVKAGPGDDVKFGDGTVVSMGGGNYIVTGTIGNQCVTINGVCVDLAAAKAQCADPASQIDVVVVDGKVVKVICYPPKSAGTPIENVVPDAQGNVQVPQNKSGTVITFGEQTNGKEIVGDVKVDAERVTIYGNGVDKTIIKGNLVMASNNCRVRGVTITGNVTIEKNSNGCSLAYCKILGNLTIHGNDAAVLVAQVFGNLEVNGNNAGLFDVGVGGNLKVNGNGATCQSLYSFKDGDNNKLIAPAERTGALLCK